ncbi:MAG: hypothetical protein LQ346_001258 [Caloplaca aetnensis]|nr:MAG: hypothetical protein LQ346_001258 [Caloplaca aetnensis]
MHQNALNSRLNWAENGRFLEQFRYTIIASQLLNDVPIPGIYKRQIHLQSVHNSIRDFYEDAETIAFSWLGLSITALAAFALVWSIHLARNVALWTPRVWPLVVAPLVAAMASLFLYLYLRRHWLHWIRSQAVKSACTLVGGAQYLDAALSASVNWIQEVELVCRGYNM